MMLRQAKAGNEDMNAAVREIGDDLVVSCPEGTFLISGDKITENAALADPTNNDWYTPADTKLIDKIKAHLEKDE